MYILRGVDGPVTFAENRDAPELMCTSDHHFVMEGDPVNAFGRGLYRPTGRNGAVRPGWRHVQDPAAHDLRPEDVHTENVRRLMDLWLRGHNRDEARGVVWPYDGSTVALNAAMWFHREKAAEQDRLAELVRARESGREYQRELEQRQAAVGKNPRTRR